MLDRAGSGFAEQRLELCEGVLDWIEVWRIWREEHQPRADGLDGTTDGGAFVRRQVVEDDDVTGAERRHEHLLDVGKEPLAGHRAVEDYRRCHAGQPQRDGKGRRLPVAVWDARAEPLAARCSTVQPGHLGASPGLIDEHEGVGIKVELALEPGLATGHDVGTILLRCMPGLFFRDLPANEEPP